MSAPFKAGVPGKGGKRVNGEVMEVIGVVGRPPEEETVVVWLFIAVLLAKLFADVVSGFRCAG